MRLTCPSCGAEYEVDDSLIPAVGREVECAACGHGWHQPGPQTRIVLGEEHAVAPAAAPPPDLPEPPPAPRTSAAALAILREEAQRELSARAAERGGAPEPDIAAARVAAATLREGDVAAPADEPAGAAPEAATPALPDPARMAESLRWSDPLPETPAAAVTPLPQRRRNRYNQGFGLAILVALVLVGAYVAAPAVGDEGPVGATLAEYRAGADRVRLWLYDRAAPPTDRAIAAIRGLFD